MHSIFETCMEAAVIDKLVTAWDTCYPYCTAQEAFNRTLWLRHFGFLMHGFGCDLADVCLIRCVHAAPAQRQTQLCQECNPCQLLREIVSADRL